MHLLPGAVQEHCITGSERSVGQLPVIGFAGLMNGQGIQAEGLTKSDFLDGLSDEAGARRYHSLVDSRQRRIEHVVLEIFRPFFEL